MVLCLIGPFFLLLVSSQPRCKVLKRSGEEVPIDSERRREAAASNPNKEADRKLQASLCTFFCVPYLWACATQENPTVSAQIAGWVEHSWSQLTDNKATLHFQLAFCALLSERLCYTWIHTFPSSFLRFCDTAVGKRLGREPLNVVLHLFYVNKLIQFSTFLTFYWYIANWRSPFADGFYARLSVISRFQWVSLFHGIFIGQGLNVSIYRAIGKAGVYYGYRLGHKVPWATGFPFSVFPHPQYFGVCVCCLGVNIWSATIVHVKAGWLNLSLVQVLLYVYMAIVEDYL